MSSKFEQQGILSERTVNAGAVIVTAPSRLHFGMTSFGRPGTRQFGGAGVAIKQPGLVIRLSPAARFDVVGPLADRATGVVQGYAERAGLKQLPACSIEVVSAPPEHIGLGTGTQLALALVGGLTAFRHQAPLTPAQLAVLAGRANRSAVGTYAFANGGLILDAGRIDGEALAPLGQRVELPTGWRFALVCRADDRGVSGEEEAIAFRDLPLVDPARANRLTAELRNELFPAATARDFDRFSESLYRYGYEAGLCFAAKQGGAFANEQVASLVQTVRSLGVRGVGQTSWGPTVFALLETEDDAERLASKVRAVSDSPHQIVIAEPSNAGAEIRCECEA